MYKCREVTVLDRRRRVKKRERERRGWGDSQDSHTLHASLKPCVCVCVQVYNVHYSMSINGKVEEGSMEIDTANNMERFSTGSGADEAVEVHDFEIVSVAESDRRISEGC